jgi:hypothetical protein
MASAVAVVRPVIKRVLGRAASPPPAYQPDFDPGTIEILETVQPYTLSGAQRVFTLCRAVEYITRYRIPGAIVECGVWKGGSMMAAAMTLRRLGELERGLYLFDTFEGMTDPTENDFDYEDRSAAEMLREAPVDSLIKACCSLQEVQANMNRVGYRGPIHYVPGPVERTLPDKAPGQIALLRLDTDWYTSTKHELVHLFPRLANGGVLIIDDYGHWKGARKAVDEYFSENRIPILLNRIDYTGRIAIKAQLS